MSGYPYQYSSSGGYSSVSPYRTPTGGSYGIPSSSPYGSGDYQSWSNFATSGIDPSVLAMGSSYAASPTALLQSNLYKMPPSFYQPPPLDDNTLLGRFQSLSQYLDTQCSNNADGVITSNDLKAALTDKKYSAQDKQVIQAMIDNQDGLRVKLDTADGQTDDHISISNISEVLSTTGSSTSTGSSAGVGQPPLDDNTLMGNLQGIAGELDTQCNGNADGLIDVGDLNSALKDTTGKYSTKDKQVIQALLNNQDGLRGKLDLLDSKNDGLFSLDSINKLVANPNATYQSPEDALTNTDAVSTLETYIEQNKDSRGTDRMDRSTLQALVNDSATTANVKLAAQKFLKNSALFDVVDTADKGGSTDGKFSMNDCKAAINNISDLNTTGMPAAPTSTSSSSLYTASTGTSNTGSTTGYNWNSVGGYPNLTQGTH